MARQDKNPSSQQNKTTGLLLLLCLPRPGQKEDTMRVTTCLMRKSQLFLPLWYVLSHCRGIQVEMQGVGNTGVARAAGRVQSKIETRKFYGKSGQKRHVAFVKRTTCSIRKLTENTKPVLEKICNKRANIRGLLGPRFLVTVQHGHTRGYCWAVNGFSAESLP